MSKKMVRLALMQIYECLDDVYCEQETLCQLSVMIQSFKICVPGRRARSKFHSFEVMEL